jgi:hypothetical protein
MRPYAVVVLQGSSRRGGNRADSVNAKLRKEMGVNSGTGMVIGAAGGIVLGPLFGSAAPFALIVGAAIGLIVGAAVTGHESHR